MAKMVVLSLPNAAFKLNFYINNSNLKKSVPGSGEMVRCLRVPTLPEDPRQIPGILVRLLTINCSFPSDDGVKNDKWCWLLVLVTGAGYCTERS